MRCSHVSVYIGPCSPRVFGKFGVVLEPVHTEVEKAQGWYGRLSAGLLFELGQECREAFSIVQNLDERFPDERFLDEAAPCFMVVGKTSAGKSTLLQRLTRLPFHPSGQQICTRVAVKVELRQGSGEPKATLQVYRFDEVKGIFVAVGKGKAISMEADSQDVQKEMNALLETEGLSKAPVVGA